MSVLLGFRLQALKNLLQMSYTQEQVGEKEINLFFRHLNSLSFHIENIKGPKQSFGQNLCVYSLVFQSLLTTEQQ